MGFNMASKVLNEELYETLQKERVEKKPNQMLLNALLPL